jgi:hypothetical protein
MLVQPGAERRFEILARKRALRNPAVGQGATRCQCSGEPGTCQRPTVLIPAEPYRLHPKAF